MKLPFLDKLRDRAARRQAIRRFDGATGTRRGWGMPTFGRINPEIGAAAVSLRSRSRALAVNNPWIAHAVANWVGALVGSGIVPVARHRESNVRRALGDLFSQASDAIDIEERTDFNGLQADIARGLVIDGEAFVHVVMTDDGPRLRIIPPELVDESMTRELGNGRIIVSGVELDADGRRLAYHIFPSKPTDQFASYSPPIRVPAEDILHVMKPIAAGQVRGVTWLAPIILSANEFDQLTDALLVGVKIAAMHAGFLIDQNGSAGEPYDGTGAGGILESGLEPGTLKRLPTGMDVKFSTPDQAKEVGAFLRFNLQQLAAGLGLPEHLLSGDLTGANYSSLRAGLLPFRQRVEAIQYHTLVPQLLNPVWRRVISYAVLSGEFDAPDFETAPRSYGAEWLPPKPLQVDPLKDTEATIAEIDAGLTSRRKAVAERGWSLDDLDDEIEADRPREQRLGLNQKKESANAKATKNPEA